MLTNIKCIVKTFEVQLHDNIIIKSILTAFADPVEKLSNSKSANSAGRQKEQNS